MKNNYQPEGKIEKIVKPQQLKAGLQAEKLKNRAYKLRKFAEDYQKSSMEQVYGVGDDAGVKPER